MNKQSEKLKVKGEKYKICATDFEGITLVALVITIIVLIILAAVSINAVMNDGLIKNAKDATEATKTENIKEQAKIAYLDWQVKSAKGEEVGTLQAYVKQYLIDNGFSGEDADRIRISDNGEIEERLSSNSTEVAEFISQMDSSLIYNVGYLTGLVDTENVASYTKATLLAKLPEGADILANDGSGVNDTEVIGSGYQIVNNHGDLIAYTVFFGSATKDPYLNAVDSTRLRNLIRDRNLKMDYINLNFVYFDLNADGVVSYADYEKMLYTIQNGGFAPYIQFDDEMMNINQFRPVTPDIEIIYDWPE